MIAENEYEKIARFLARKYMFYVKDKSFQEEDFIQEGLIALHRARATYDKDKGALFETYASRVIENRYKDLLKRKTPATQTQSAEEGCDITDYLDNDNEKGEIDLLLYVYSLEKFLKEKIKAIEYDIYKLWEQGFSNREIATKQELTEKKVDNSLQKVKRFIKEFNSRYGNCTY